jgi:DNA-binding response OmpR family regulator
MRLLITLDNAEAGASIGRLCAHIGMEAVSFTAIPSTINSFTHHLQEKAGAVMLQQVGAETILFSLPLPLRLHALQERLMKLAKCHTQQRTSRLLIGKGLYLDTGRRHIRRGEEGEALCELTEKETELLAYLHRCGEAGEEKETLLTDLWGYHPDAETRTIDSHLYRLRQKLAELPKEFRVEITAQQGRYRLSHA